MNACHACARMCTHVMSSSHTIGIQRRRASALTGAFRATLSPCLSPCGQPLQAVDRYGKRNHSLLCCRNGCTGHAARATRRYAARAVLQHSSSKAPGRHAKCGAGFTLLRRAPLQPPLHCQRCRHAHARARLGAALRARWRHCCWPGPAASASAAPQTPR